MKSLSVDLEDRILRFDGVSIISPEEVVAALLRGVKPSELRLTHITPDIELFNQNVDDQLKVQGIGPININFEWQLPPYYQQLDIYAKIGEIYEKRTEELYAEYSQQQYDASLERIVAELAEFERRGMVELLRTIIYIVDTFREKGVVWGVGRGSSCASYVLFLIGLHCVDCVKFEIPLTEFFHD